MSDLVFIKLGGSLITDKRRPEAARPEVIERLGVELAEISRIRPGGIVVGHGSGSFGHASASRYDLRGRLTSDRQLEGVAVTRCRAAELDQLLVRALLDGSAKPFSCPPSSWMTAVRGEPERLEPGPLFDALALGLLPLVYGDVVIDSEWGASICSTETVFLALARAAMRRGHRISAALWLGETDGIYDAAGSTVRELTPASSEAILGSVRGAEGVDVTGGMRHRLESVVELARRGVTSWIGDGRESGVLERAIAGTESSGTWMRPDGE